MLAFWVCALVLGATQAWTSRFEMSPDGITYLDNADAYFRKDWDAAANSEWSPMYPWLLGVGMHFLQPSPYWEFPALHLVNFVVFLGVLAAFHFFLTTLLMRLREPLQIHVSSIAAIACAAFLYSMLDFTNVINPTPDLTMAAFVFLAAAFLLRINDGDRSFATFLLFGVTLGLGYIAKAPFMIFAFVCFAIVLGLTFRNRGNMARIALLVCAFAVTAGPYVVFLSLHKGYFTWGDSGRYNLIWMVDGIPYYHWQGGPAGNGTPVHPAHLLSVDPAVYEFATPISGTYPLWYDPIYWYKGATFRFSPVLFLHAAVRCARTYLFLFHHRQTPLICGLLMLYVLVPVKRMFAHQLWLYKSLLGFAVFPFIMYDMVHVDPRFLGAFFVLLWTALFTAVILASPPSYAQVTGVIAGIVAVMMTIEAVLVAGPTHPIQPVQGAALSQPAQNPQWEIANALRRIGVHAGDQAAIIGSDLPYFWARLARVKIVAEFMPRDVAYDRQAEAARIMEWERAKIFLKATPARFVVSPAMPGIVDQPGWERLGSTEAFVFDLKH